MKKVSVALLLLALISCVPAKKYNELYNREKACAEELQKFKAMALDFESKFKAAKEELDRYKSDAEILKKDTSDLGTELRNLQVKYDYNKSELDKLEKKFNTLMDNSSKQSSEMGQTLEAQRLNLQEQQDRLTRLSEELSDKEAKLLDRERRVKELEELLSQQENALKSLKEKIALALRGFEDKGLTVEERNGRIYISMEAKLLFSSGSTVVDKKGEEALTQLAQALEDQKDVDIIVEGHTDSDAMNSPKHPKNNWELSVLRATAVVQILINNSEIDPTQLTAAGRSEYHPVDPEDKSKNRRIEIIISPNLDALFEIINS